MNSITVSNLFKRKVKPLAKKYKTLPQSIDNLGSQLILNPYLGESYGADIYKIRLADESKGKRGGFRVMYYLAVKNVDSVTIVLMTIFDKGEVNTITKKDAEAIKSEILKSLG